ncbi:hypothetical protein BB561_001335 [Smittium simulii]|uniref:Glycoside hydrolase family 5 domain-containing protein n=1 Tax=Smittium simulii TaxID=133385 RepID=A0A2T9YV65_9FUNG|nr:hypothetical protein BB561_001335 [Smittium simulii]
MTEENCLFLDENLSLSEIDNASIKSYFKYSPYINEAQDLKDLDSLYCQGTRFINQKNQSVYLRGVNIGGHSKLPYNNNGNNSIAKIDYNTLKDVTFVNRPFPLTEAKSHFMLLKSWGLTLIRLIVTWEALEHKGPGIYDIEFINYLKDLLDIMHDCGLKCMIDPHQDMWSRFSGGSGAPSWTLEVSGLNIRNLVNTGAAYIYSESYCATEQQPKMKWATNASKLASSTMFTLFFGGNTFAPNTMVDDLNIQDYLQNHYIECYRNLASSLKNSKAVLGFESMNEPE